MQPKTVTERSPRRLRRKRSCSQPQVWHQKTPWNNNIPEYTLKSQKPVWVAFSSPHKQWIAGSVFFVSLENRIKTPQMYTEKVQLVRSKKVLLTKLTKHDPLGTPKGAQQLTNNVNKYFQTELKHVSEMARDGCLKRNSAAQGLRCGAQVKHHIPRKAWVNIRENVHLARWPKQGALVIQGYGLPGSTSPLKHGIKVLVQTLQKGSWVELWD